MRYCVSDVHAELGLFKRLIEKIGFGADDEMYICGDIIDKGESSVKLLKYVKSFPNIHCILGNHEYAFLKYYNSILENSPDDFDTVLQKLQAYFQGDGALLDWELVDWIDDLPPYIETNDFICVHAGIPIDSHGFLAPLDSVSTEQLVHDRRFKEPSAVHQSPKCVFFGHTQTDGICGEAKIIGYRRNPREVTKSIADYYKIHLDTGTWNNGVLGCFCIDTCRAVYVKK